MKRYALVFSIGLAIIISVGFAVAQNGAAKPAAPQVTGDWSGTWGLYAPPALGKEPAPNAQPQLPAIHFQMTCKVEEISAGKYQAAFEGNAGRPYKFVIKMPGRQVGDVAMFSGTADLGDKDGGIYDWIGRANGKEFIGFFTSRGYTGSFRLARPEKSP